jgi:beta-galactosidase/beta-glucuronidase
MKHKLILLTVISVLLTFCQKPVFQSKIDLSGQWSFAIDSLDRGIPEKWFDRALADQVTRPGSMTSNGKGDDISLKTPWTGQIVDSSYFKNPEYAKYRQPGNIKIPFWLQPVKYYKGAAWYQKEVTIPENWDQKHIRLFLERCHWESRLWVDDKEAGMQNSLGTPHQYDLSALLTPGKHRLTLCIDNRVKDIDPG